MANSCKVNASSTHFISSLSRSIQALCRDCFDFDSEIEIVGYLNVAIDKWKKIDFDVKEHVQRLTGDSFKFGGDSCVAKKDIQIKTTNTGCAPQQLDICCVHNLQDTTNNQYSEKGPNFQKDCQ